MSTKHRSQTPDPLWTISFNSYDPEDEGRREAILALGNGLYVTRAADLASRNDLIHYPGTYRVGCYDRIANDIAGTRVETESLVNLPNWLFLSFRLEDGSWFNIDEAELLDYSHALHLKTGTCSRTFTLLEKGGRRVHVRENRLVSMAFPNLAAIRLELTVHGGASHIEFCSALDGNVINRNVPRYVNYDPHHLVAHRCTAACDAVALYARTPQSLTDILEASRTTVFCKNDVCRSVSRDDAFIADQARCEIEAEETIAVEKIVLLSTSLDPPGCHSAATAEQTLRKAGSFADLCTSHEGAWRGLWSRVAIATDNQDALLALRLHAFHILQTASPHSVDLDVGIPARGWHGEGYRGHIFWDELFIFPFLNFRFPKLAKSLLLYRYRRLGAAREEAKNQGYRGAMYPWRSASDGREVTPHFQCNLLSGRWMSDPTQLQRHIGSAIALNVWQYYATTGDADFLSHYGAEMILEIARFWASIAQPTADGERFEIRGVIGPDEYHTGYPNTSSPGLDNNAYTNVMAVWTLCRALEVLDHLTPDRREELSRELDLGQEELQRWDHISRRMKVSFHDDGIISQFEGFENLRELSKDTLPESLADKRIDWALEAIGESANAYQVTKQADVLTLFHLLPEKEIVLLLGRLGYSFDNDRLLRTAQYYLARTTHRSSLSRIVYAGALAQVDPNQSWRLYSEALGTDLHALKSESIAEGIHLGAMGGTLDVLQRRYLGIAACSDGLCLNPVVPAQLGTVAMNLHYRGNELEVEASGSCLRIRSDAANRKSVNIIHPGGQAVLEPGTEVSIGKQSGSRKVQKHTAQE